nr:unnamed protein product [Spirometra erinaceieuropaei]
MYGTAHQHFGFGRPFRFSSSGSSLALFGRIPRVVVHCEEFPQRLDLDLAGWIGALGFYMLNKEDSLQLKSCFKYPKMKRCGRLVILVLMFLLHSKAGCSKYPNDLDKTQPTAHLSWKIKWDYRDDRHCVKDIRTRLNNVTAGKCPENIFYTTTF